MIKYTQGNILEATTQALVNTVNTYGVMGKGIALAFKRAYKGNFKAYRSAYEKGELAVGEMFLFATGLDQPAFIINFPTKEHWRYRSKMEYIEVGLVDFVQTLKDNNIQSVAIPPLGCGNGGLKWEEVKPLILKTINPLADKIDFIIYEPGYQSAVAKVKSVDKLTPARAMFLTLMRQYEMLGEELTTLVVQKLAYLLQITGEPLRLRYDKGNYGPFASNLNQVLEALKPNYITYDGELNSPYTTIRLVQSKKEETKEFVQKNLDLFQKKNLEKVQDYIEGFENAFGLELLATVAYAVAECPHCSKEEIIGSIHEWTKRKKELMSGHLIGVAYDRVKSFSK